MDPRDTLPLVEGLSSAQHAVASNLAHALQHPQERLKYPFAWHGLGGPARFRPELLHKPDLPLFQREGMGYISINAGRGEAT
jgi:hypothetical protein